MKNIKSILIVFILITPLWKGLYFDYGVAFSAAFLLLLLGYYFIRAKEIRFPQDMRFYAMVAIGVLYGLTPFYALDWGMSLFGILRFGEILLFYILCIQIDPIKNKESLFTAVAYSGVILSTAGLIGVIIPSFREIVLQDNRLGSLVQYPNTLGVYLLICIILFYRMESTDFKQVISLISLWAAFILTFSRSLYVFGLMIVIGCCILEYKKIKRIVGTVLTGGILGTILIYAVQLMETAERVKSISPGASEWQTRLLYYADGLQILKEYPFGLGSLGYYYIQKLYQTGIYHVKYIHNGILQIGMDIGIPGVLLILLVFASYGMMKKKLSYEILIVGLIFFHGMVDFDWVFPIVFHVLCLLFGMEKSKIKTYAFANTKFIIGFGFLIFLCLWIGGAALLYYRGYYEQAVKMLPFYTEARLAYGKQKADVSEILEIMADIQEQNPYVEDTYMIQRTIYTSLDQYDLALGAARKVMELDPLDITEVENFSQLSLKAAKKAAREGDITKEKKYLTEIVKLNDYVQRQNKRISPRAYKVKHIPTMVMTKKLLDHRQLAMERLEELRWNYGE